MDESGYAAGELVCTVSPEARRNIAQGAKPSWGRAGGCPVDGHPCSVPA